MLCIYFLHVGCCVPKMQYVLPTNVWGGNFYIDILPKVLTFLQAKTYVERETIKKIVFEVYGEIAPLSTMWELF